MAADADDWDGGWDADRDAKRRDWQERTPAERLRWLEDALDLAYRAGALDADRRARARQASRWPKDG